MAEKYEWLSLDMVCELVETRSRSEALEGENNSMKRDDIASQFSGENKSTLLPTCASLTPLECASLSLIDIPHLR
jgi:hypothetical protein